MISRLFCFQFIHDPVVSISFVLSRFVSYETYLKRLSYCENLILDGLSDMFDFVCDLEAVEMWASGREIPEHCWESGSSGMLKGQSMEAGNGRSWSDHRNEKCVYVTICVHVHMNIYTYIFIFSYLGIWNYNLVSSDFGEIALLFYYSLFNFISFCSLVINRIYLFRIAWKYLFICPQ